MTNNNISSVAPVEPVLDTHDIQGNTVPGFNKPHQYILCFKIGDVAPAKEFLKAIVPYISNVTEVLGFRRKFRASRKASPNGKADPALKATWLNIAFSYPGIKKLTSDAESFESEAFKIGLEQRSPLLGDPTSPENEGSPTNWVVGSGDKVADILILVGGDDQEDLAEKVKYAVDVAKKCQLECIYNEEMNMIERDGVTGLEQFGFKDGISQPGVRGTVNNDPTDYLEERYIAKDVLPESLLYGKPGQFLSWPGEFIFGYPAQTLDPLVPGNTRNEGPAWTKNGSFMVFRRYKQDVKLFWKYMKDTADGLAEKEEFKGMTPHKLAASLMGRWPSGAPFARTPDQDNKDLGADPMANNYFRYASDSCPIKVIHGYEDKFPMAKADPVGLTCPMTGHIRKVNTRDTANDAGGTLASFNQRLLRRGLPFGKPLTDPLDPNEPDPENGNRGLLFMSYQTSIEDQFEFLRNRWMSNRFTPRSPSGDDIAIGLNGNVGQDRERTGTIFGTGAASENLSTRDQWITPTGGGYFFSPSISAIRDVLSR